MQNHIHLSETVSGAPENAPDTIWTVTNRTEIPNVVMTYERTLTGKLRRHILREGGNPVQFYDYGYELKIYDYGGKTTEQRLAQIRSMAGKFVYLVDVPHPDDGQNHAAYVKTMLVNRVGDISPFTKSGQLYYVTIELVDASRR